MHAVMQHGCHLVLRAGQSKSAVKLGQIIDLDFKQEITIGIGGEIKFAPQ